MPIRSPKVLTISNNDNVTAPVPSFDVFGLDEKILRGIRDCGFVQPTRIQNEAIGPGLKKRDILGSSATGSGKTAAFVLPMLQQFMKKPRGTTRALVLSPTRELAAQIVEHTRDLARHCPVSSDAIFGGVGMHGQIRALRRGTDILVATPGRLLDHMQNDYANLSGLEILVLDEADRMLDMGFLPDVRRIRRQLPKNLQTWLFSATMPKQIVELSRQLLESPVALNIKRKSSPAKGITHHVYPVPMRLKPDLLIAILKKEEHDSVLAFTRTKHRANRLNEKLRRQGIKSSVIHGNRSQNQRTEALKGFKRGKYRVLVATDIAARGIDIQELDLVVNVDVPHIPEDYIHRVGRTARAEASGLAITMVDRMEQRDLAGIEKHVNMRFNRVKLDDFDYSVTPDEQFEIPLQERLAKMRKQRAEQRAKSREKERKQQADSHSDHTAGKTAHHTGPRKKSSVKPWRFRRKRKTSSGNHSAG